MAKAVPKINSHIAFVNGDWFLYFFIDKLALKSLNFLSLMSYPFTREPRPHQVKGMKRLYRIQRQLFWWEPGEGKTKVALDFIGTLLWHKLVKRALIISSKTAVRGVWVEQMEIDCPWMRYSLLLKKEKVDWTAPVILTNYDYFSPRRVKKRSKRTGEVIPDKFVRKHDRLDTLLEWEPDIVVLDESHRIKNPFSRRGKACHKLGRVCKYAIALTGTIKGNKRILDLWSQFQFIYPGLLESTFGDYKRHYVIYGGFCNHEVKKFINVDELTDKIRPYVMLHKATGLPKQVDIPYRIDLEPRIKTMYKQMEKDMLIELSKEKTITAPIALAKFVKLSQIAGGFIRDNEGIDHALHTNKLDALREIVEDLKEADVERVVIFARFTWEIEEIRKQLHDWVTYTLTGKVPEEQRALAKSMFDSSGGAMICQTSVGSESLNLQAANYEIFYSTDYSLINYTQARKRIHRQGQTKNCYYYQLRAKGTIDTKIYRMFSEGRSADIEFEQLLEEIKSGRSD